MGLLPIWGFPDSSVGKESTFNAGNPGSLPELGRSSGEGNGYPLQYSGLRNSTDCIVHGVSKSRTWLSDFHFTSLDKCKATLGTALWQRQLVACQESPFLFFLKHNLDFLLVTVLPGQRFLCPKPLHSRVAVWCEEKLLYYLGLLESPMGGRSQDGGGIGRGDYFLFYKFIERTTERWRKFTKQLLIASRGHQAPRKAAYCLRREVGQKY